jgi:hypothetical protein
VSVVYLVCKVILLGNPWGEKGERDVHVFILIEGGRKVEIVMSKHIYFASGVLSTLFQCSFEVVMSAVRVVSSPG